MNVATLLDQNDWLLVSRTTDAGPGFLRFRRPILKAGEGGSHPILIQVLWAYADEGAAALPDDDVAQEMAVFENRLCAAWEETDSLAVLAAVLTLDGARQWIFYTHDVEICGARLNEMPQEQDPYPIEITAANDPDWTFLRENVLRDVEIPRS